MSKRTYSDSDKATALALLTAHAGNISATARAAGVPASTLRKWRDGQGVSGEVTQMCEEKKGALCDLFERVARLYLGRAMDDSALQETKGKDAVIAAATATDKMQLLKGEPTNIHKDVTLTDAQRRRAAEIRRKRGEVQQTESVNN